MGVRVPREVRAGFAERLEHVLPAGLVVPPAAGLENQRPLGPVGNDEAVDHVVDLAPVATTLRGGGEREREQ